MSSKQEAGAVVPHYVTDYNRHVTDLLRVHQIDEAMSLAVGGNWSTLGPVQAETLKLLGLREDMTVVDLGCGSGRTAHYVANLFPKISYLGIDVVDSLLDYARGKAPKHFKFVRQDDLTIPTASLSVDFIFAFSLFTHLRHEETYCYLQEVVRALRPGGTLVFSFLEFACVPHWTVFEVMVQSRRTNASAPLNMFLEASVIEIWAAKLGFSIKEILRGHPLGQSIVHLQKLG